MSEKPPKKTISFGTPLPGSKDWELLMKSAPFVDELVLDTSREYRREFLGEPMPSEKDDSEGRRAAEILLRENPGLFRMERVETDVDLAKDTFLIRAVLSVEVTRGAMIDMLTGRGLYGGLKIERAERTRRDFESSKVEFPSEKINPKTGKPVAEEEDDEAELEADVSASEAEDDERIVDGEK